MQVAGRSTAFRIAALALLVSCGCRARGSTDRKAVAPVPPAKPAVSSNDDDAGGEAEPVATLAAAEKPPSESSTTPSGPPALRALGEDERYEVLLLGEWSFAPDVDRWASYNDPVSCAAVLANKFGGVKIERRTRSGRRRTPLEFRDVGGTDEDFQTFAEQTAAFLERKPVDIVVVMMGQVDEPLVHDGVELEGQSEGWRAEYERRMRQVLEVLAPSRRHVVWLELPTLWPSHDPTQWAGRRDVQGDVLSDPTLRVDRRKTEPFSPDNAAKRTEAELSEWLVGKAVEPICEAARG